MVGMPTIWSDGHIVVLGRLAQISQEFSKFTRFVVGDGDRIRF